MKDTIEFESFKISASLNADDLRRYEKTKRTGRDILINVFFLIGILASGLVVVGLVTEFTGEPLLGIVGFGVFYFATSLIMRRQAKARLTRISEELVPYELVIDRIGVTQKIGRAETRYKWSELERVEKLPDFIEISAWDGGVYVLPRSAFESADDFDSVFEFASGMQQSVEVGHG